MKTTVEVSDALMAEARKLADRRGVTLRQLIEEGLRHVLKSSRRQAPFRMRDASFGGEGLSPEFAAADWEVLRDAAYAGRGA